MMIAARIAHSVRSSSSLRALAGGTSLMESSSRQPPTPTRWPSGMNAMVLDHSYHLTARPSSSSSTSMASGNQSSLRRRRRKRGGKATDNEQQDLIAEDPSTTTTSSSAFAPVDSSGQLLDAQSYLSLASLSPWVPCPDMVVKRVLEIAEVTSSGGEDNEEEGDVHVDLGCGDGRLNFAALDMGVKKSWGVDVDENVLERCRERLGRRFVPGGGGMGEMKSNGGEEALEFVQADLIEVVKRQKEKYQQMKKQQQLNNSSDGPPLEGSQSSQDVPITESEEEEESCHITKKLSQSTIVTMYFVDDALKQLRPYLANTLGQKDNVRVVTIGYEMKGGWEPTWVERVLGLTIFKYDMKNISRDPVEWQIEGEEVVGSGGSEGRNEKNNPLLDLDEEFDDLDEETDSKLAEYLRQKREQDMQELNEGLRIHHDEALNDFAQHRHTAKQNIHNSASSSHASSSPLELEDEEDDWDFDETEDPEVLMADAQRIMTEARMASRGKGMTAGLDVERTKAKGKGGKVKAGAKPIWKKP